MSTFLEIQNEVLQLLHGYGLEQPRTTYLSSALDDNTLTASVLDAASVDQGVVEIEGELLFVLSVNRDTNVVTFAPDGRGYYGTTAAAHASGNRVVVNPTWPKNRIKGAVNDTIAGVFPTLFGVAQTQFTYNPSVTTYSLPAEAESVLSVTGDTNGPSMEQQRIVRYRFDSVAPADDWATGNSLTLQEAPSPGRTVTVTYTKAPSALSADEDALTASGLRETAKEVVVLGALARLVSKMDMARLPVDTAQAQEFDQPNQIGMATRIAGQLRLQYEAELEAERKRLRTTTSVPLTRRRR